MITTGIGPFVKCPHPEMIEAIAIAGFDFAVVDMEHTILNPNNLYPLVLASEARNIDLIVRIPDKSETYIKWCRDLNISSIQVPHIESKEDVLRAINYSYFSPLGSRGLCRFTRAADFSGKSKDTYIKEANNLNNLILQIEGMNAIKNFDSILDSLVPNIAIFIGPYDLSQSLGKPGEIWDKEVVEMMEEIIQKCLNREISVGTFTDSPDGIDYWRKKRISFIEYASDLNLFIGASKQLLSPKV
jgi:4-hydroxy-2-oxoheptanedioate aldolase